MTWATITPLELETLVKYVYDLCGILLDQSKAYLFESRLGPLLQEFQCVNYYALYDKARHDPSQKIPNRIIDAICTGETSFFRDTLPFQLLQGKLLPDYLESSTQGGAEEPPTLRSGARRARRGRRSTVLP